jgi:hypothetical protein
MNHPTPPPAATRRAAARNDGPSCGIAAPRLELPKGGGALRGIGETFAANPVTGTGGLTVPIAASPGRGGFGPRLALVYDSGAGNGPFGVGWSLGMPQVTRRTDKGLPRYDDAGESDVFMLAGADDLVPVLQADGSRFEDHLSAPGHMVHRYRPRMEGAFARIERWTRRSDGDVHWRSISRDNVLSVYGLDAASRIADPADARRIFSWLLCETRDDKGNAIVYGYQREDGAGVDLTQPPERNRGPQDDPRRAVQRHLKRIRYGNLAPLLDAEGQRPPLLDAAALASTTWLFELVFDYGDHDLAAPRAAADTPWALRPDPFSTCRPGFELRTSRRCRRVLMFHHFAHERRCGPRLPGAIDRLALRR